MSQCLGEFWAMSHGSMLLVSLETTQEKLKTLKGSSEAWTTMLSTCHKLNEPAISWTWAAEPAINWTWRAEGFILYSAQYAAQAAWNRAAQVSSGSCSAFILWFSLLTCVCATVVPPIAVYLSSPTSWQGIRSSGGDSSTETGSFTACQKSRQAKSAQDACSAFHFSFEIF